MSIEIISTLDNQSRQLIQYSKDHPESPIARANVSRMFTKAAPRPLDMTYQVADRQRAMIAKDPDLVKLLGLWVDTLSSQDLEEEIINERETYGMFKPQVGKSLLNHRTVPEEDEQFLIDEWCKDFYNQYCDVFAPISLTMTPETYEQFYAGNKGWQSTIPVDSFQPYAYVPQNPEDWTLFNQIKAGMLAGPTTPCIVNSRVGNAVETWRKILGPSNPDKDRNDPKYRNSFRSRWAKASSNTLVHGSGKIKVPEQTLVNGTEETPIIRTEALQEILWYRDRVAEMIRTQVQV